ncbi:hypothetical protein [Streptomyces sp. NPDC059009]|uniref:hypothetical protein n=1 Tax=Streptomyces sp. NPDC059009 TaxID=3346694 RepID=UPI0036C32BAB
MTPRLIALLGVVAATVLLPLAAASAGSLGDAVDGVGTVDAKPTVHSPEPTPRPAVEPSVKPTPEPSGADPDDPDKSPRKPPEKPRGQSLLSGLGLTTAARCGPELTSPDGIEAQTCVLSQGHDTWARTYYRNATGEELSAVLTLMSPGGTVEMHCAVGADDEPGACETPRERTAGEAERYAAVAEFAAAGEEAGEHGALLLRSGSNSPRPQGS